ncbi:MAG: hypothetical protein F4118_02375, partial [Acidimicrobiaceae bacterium]|nr:hypothetical protein [Acidimicrobiaceae bacterium]
MKSQTHSKRVLGIDPGLANTGWSVVSRQRSGRFQHRASGVIRTERQSRDDDESHPPQSLPGAPTVCSLVFVRAPVLVTSPLQVACSVRM